jgi:hypothetical protein
MLDALSYEELAAETGTKFTVSDASDSLELELTEITERRATPQQEYFSLIFRGPRSFMLPQGVYRLSHKRLGTGELFLVPVGVGGESAEYEAAFNRLLGDV